VRSAAGYGLPHRHRLRHRHPEPHPVRGRCGSPGGSLVFAPLAAAESVLEDEEKEQGVILVDIGGGTTDIAVFMEGAVFHTTVLPVGGYHLTHDLVAGLRAPYSTVEEIKLNHGSCMPSRVDAEEIVDIDAFGGQRTKAVPPRRIAAILQARREEAR